MQWAGLANGCGHVQGRPECQASGVTHLLLTAFSKHPEAIWISTVLLQLGPGFHTCIGMLRNLLLRLLCGMHCWQKGCSLSAGAGDRASRCKREHKGACAVAANAGAAAPATCHGRASQPLPYLRAAWGAQVCPDQRRSSSDVGWESIGLTGRDQM